MSSLSSSSSSTNHNVMETKKSDSNNKVKVKVLTSADLLLLPQRNIKETLHNMGFTSFLDMVAAAPPEEEEKEIDVKKEEIIELPIINDDREYNKLKLPSKFELTFIMKSPGDVHKNELLLQNLISFLTEVENYYLVLLNKRIYNRIIKQSFYFTIGTTVFNRYSMHIMNNSNSIGFINSNKLIFSPINNHIDDEQLDNFSNYIVSYQGNVVFHSINLSILPVVAEHTILRYLNSFLLNKNFCYYINELNFDGSAIGPVCINALIEIMKSNYLPLLKILNINRNNATEIGVKKIRLALQTKCCPTLESLSISFNTCPLTTLDLFDHMFTRNMSTITNIESCNNNIDLLAPEIVSVLNKGTLSLSHLKCLNLSYNPLSDDGLYKLLSVAWPVNKKATNYKDIIRMEKLILNHTNISNKTMSYLSLILPQFVKLTHLSLAGNDIPAESIQQLVDVLLNVPSLKELYMPLNNFGNDGLLHFIGGANRGLLIHLEKIDISDVGANSDMCNQLVRTISALDKNLAMKKLKYLRVYGTSPYCGPNYRAVLPISFKKQVQVS